MKKILNTLLISSLLIFTSCKTEKIVTKGVINPSLSKNTLLKEISKPIDFDYLKIKSSIKLDIGQNIPTINAVLYLEKSNLIYGNANVSLFGVGKILLSRKEVKAYEKIQKTYINTDYKFVNDVLDLNFINLISIERLLLGQLFIPLNMNNFSIQTHENYYELNSIKPVRVLGKKEHHFFQIQLRYNADFNLSQVALRDKSGTFIGIKYANYTKLNKGEIPKSIKILVKNKKEVFLDIEYSKFEEVKIDPVFSIPEGYLPRMLN